MSHARHNHTLRQSHIKRGTSVNLLGFTSLVLIPRTSLFCIAFKLNKCFIEKISISGLSTMRYNPIESEDLDTEPILEGKSKRKSSRRVGRSEYESVSRSNRSFFESVNTGRETVDSNMLRDNAKKSLTLAIFSAMFFISFIVVVVWQVLVAKCIVSSVCETIDRSSVILSDYLFKTFAFRVPSALVWIGLPTGFLGLLISSAYAFFVLTRPVGSMKMAEISTVTRTTSASFLIQQYCIAIAPATILFIATGFAVNWRTATSFAIGAVLCLMTSQVGMSISTRANVRTSTAAHIGIQEAISVAGRSGAVVSLASLSIAIIGVSTVYLMLSDIRALGGFSAGAAISALYMRISGGIYTKAKRTSLKIIQESRNISRRSLSNATVLKGYVDSGAGDISGIGPDLFDSFASSVIATALLGSSLPFFYRDNFAMCVFNHLQIDQECGSFGYPRVLSHAVYICRNENLYLSYPSLTTWASNAAFVAVPFILGAVGALTSFVCATYTGVGSNMTSERILKKDAVKFILYGIRRNMLIGTVLLILSSAAVFFGLFGPNSEFQQSIGFSSADNLKLLELDGSSEQCTPKSLVATGEDRVPFPIAQGAVKKTGKYKPISASGVSLGAANRTAWRLFGCSVVGIVIGAGIASFSSLHFTSLMSGPTILLAQAAKINRRRAIAQGFGNGLITTVSPMGMILIAVVAGYTLYGAYGIGITTIGFISSSGIVGTELIFGNIADNANEIASILPMSQWAQANAEMLDLVGSSTTATGVVFSNGAAILTSITLLMAVVQQSGIVPSPRDLVGSAEFLPRRLIGSSRIVSLSNIDVVGSVIVGTILPFVMAGLLLFGVRRASQVMVAKSRKKAADETKKSCQIFRGSTGVALEESIAPIVVTLMAPLIVGFSFGQQALVGMLVSIIGMGFLLGTFLTNAAASWISAEKLIACGAFGKETTIGSTWHMNAIDARDFGGGFRDCVGPSLRMMIKATASISLVSVTAMNIDGRDGWIGGLLLAVGVVGLGISALWTVKRDRKIESEEDLEEESQPKRVPLPISPFLKDGVMVDPDCVMPGSGMCESPMAMGRRKRPVSPASSFGKSDRSETEIQEIQKVSFPHIVLPMSRSVLLDETRDLD